MSNTQHESVEQEDDNALPFKDGQLEETEQEYVRELDARLLKYCPSCGEKSLAYHMWGFPAYDLNAHLKQAKVKYMGCCLPLDEDIPEDAESYTCESCGFVLHHLIAFPYLPQ